jgi:hypothetical protein
LPVSPRDYEGRAACSGDVAIVASLGGVVREVGVARRGNSLVLDLRGDEALVPIDLPEVQHGDPPVMLVTSSCCGELDHIPMQTGAPTLFVPREALRGCTLSTVPVR